MAGSIGPKVLELESVANQARSLVTAISLETNAGPVKLEVSQSNPASYGGAWAYGTASGTNRHRAWVSAQSLSQALLQLAQKAPSTATIDPDTVSCSSSKSPLKGKGLKELCILAWHEILGHALPSPEALAAAQSARREAQSAAQKEAKAKRAALLALLAEGAPGVKRWNKGIAEVQEVAPFRKAKLSGLNLAGVKLVDMPEGNFSGSDLTGAKLGRLNLAKANFQGAVLARASLGRTNLKRADFTGADLRGAYLPQAELQGTVFVNADLTDTDFNKARFDESTVWPEGVAVPEHLVWTGEGPNPAALAALDVKKREEGPVDLNTFMKRLEESVDAGRLDKALRMLKKDRFQLFVDVGDAALTGVVKSQTDPELVYSCRLNDRGGFSCCTQNLNVCGGLRGALCKHLLLLIVGMAHAGQVDPDTLDDWVQRSGLNSPVLDKEAMSAILLKYKGAEAVEVDWRHTETVPEDFYAL